MTRKERYKADPEYRAAVLKKNRASHHRRMKDPLHAKIHAARGRIANARICLSHHEERVRFFLSRVAADVKILARLLKQRDERSRG